MMLTSLLAIALAHRQSNVLTTAGDGESIYYPTSGKTYNVVSNGQTIEVPVGMVYVPAGTFTMGTGTTATSVTLPAYAIGKFDVTNAEYAAFCAATGHKTPSYWTSGTYPSGRANHPVAWVSLVDARAYAAWVSAETGWKVAVPTAPQWEHAARGPANTLFPWGNALGATVRNGVLKTRCNYNAVETIDALTNHGTETTTYDNANSTLYGQSTTVKGIVAVDTSGNKTAFAIDATGYVSGWVNHDTYTGFIYTAYFDALNTAGGNTTPVGAYASGVGGYGAYDMAGEIYNWTESTIIATNGVEAGQTVQDVRGGSWYAVGVSCKSISSGEGRFYSGAYNTVGFRIVVVPD